MRGARERWSWDELVDFEVALAAWDGETAPPGFTPPEKASRPKVMKAWLAAVGSPKVGRRWLGGLAWAGAIASGVAFLAGFGTAWGCHDPNREGIDVVIFLVVSLLLPWLALLAGLVVWMIRPRWGGLAGPVLRRLTERFAGKEGREVLARIEASPELAKSLGWKLAARAQSAALNYHLGAIVGLTLLYFLRRTGFYWETTTEEAMERTLEMVTRFLSAPWSEVLPRMVPEIAESRRGAAWEGGGNSWLSFLMLALLVWGVLPRFLLEIFAHTKSALAVRRPAFQSPRHRRLWRLLAGTKRGDDPEGPADGALVLDVGGISPDRDALRPVILRRLRLNPVAWATLGVLDEGHEAAAETALAKATGGVVVLAEGWSLAPRRMEEVLRRVVGAAAGRRVVLHVADFDRDGRPRAPKPEDRAAWETFFDGQKGMDLELSLHEEDRTWAPG